MILHTESPSDSFRCLEITTPSKFCLTYGSLNSTAGGMHGVGIVGTWGATILILSQHRSQSWIHRIASKKQVCVSRRVNAPSEPLEEE
jgi:hypothetical protein